MSLILWIFHIIFQILILYKLHFIDLNFKYISIYLIVLGCLSLFYHIFKIYKQQTYYIINLIHILILSPILLYVGFLKKDWIINNPALYQVNNFITIISYGSLVFFTIKVLNIIKANNL